MSSIGEAARQKIEAFEAGDVEPGTEPVTPAPSEPVGADPDGADPVGSDPTPSEPEVVEPTEEEQEAAEEAADAAADALGEDATEEEREAARQEARDEFFLGTYKTKDDAEKGLREKDDTINRLFSERDRLLREADERRQQEEQQPEEIDLPAWEQWAADQVAAGAGENGAMAALREGGYDGYQVYLRHWMTATNEDGEPDAEARAQAVLYNNEVVMSIAEVRAAAAAERARRQPSAKEATEQANELVRTKRPDFDEYGEAMTQVVSELPAEDLRYLKSLTESGVEGQAKALDIVYLEAKARGPKTSAAQQVERNRRKASAAAATVAATSVTAEGTSSRTPPPAAEAEGIRRKQGIRARQNLEIDDGLSAD